ncbi:DUF6896 domain-containing protein [Pseudomonas trivialis]|uniref:DUF6896 domain-containing protein n=1 Tax=Pseudomonas trivialis TaxID=200450 RepID=UPI003D15FE03
MCVDFDYGPDGRLDGFDLWRLYMYACELPKKYKKYNDKDLLEREFNTCLIKGRQRRSKVPPPTCTSRVMYRAVSQGTTNANGNIITLHTKSGREKAARSYSYVFYGDLCNDTLLNFTSLNIEGVHYDHPDCNEHFIKLVAERIDVSFQ